MPSRQSRPRAPGGKMVVGASFARGRSFSWTQARHRIRFALGGSVSASSFGPQAVMVSGKRIALAPMEMRILGFLLERQGQISTREQLIEAVWPDPHVVESRTVDVHIGRLRRAVGGLRNLRIRTVYGAGCALEYHDH
ncbi:helix-turn-helix domain-containing protein [Rhizobium ruizarguesonis]|uniref:helix-turn-helix domain-containing protein n=3 Tax=Rhizobium ruizarguesonis TaxID=2081791 RepID=UPI0028BED129|nr:helix-turn-helix domain-containing protein [Rhizobium ruizarguesonis]